MKTFYNLQEEEQLANEVQKYRCLYKSNPTKTKDILAKTYRK